MTPSDPDTILTALHEAKRLTEERGQKKTIFTSDQQLYKVAVEVKWTDPERFADVIVRLGGMHMLMSFVGAIGTLMQGSGLVDVLSSTFSGVSKMLSGKKFPQNARALRIVCEELLRRVLERSDIHTMDELIKHLDYLADKSKTAKLWIDCLIKPVFIMMLYVRAEREGDWPLHLAAVRKMLPIFFSSSHVNYARYGLYYLRSMESLDSEVLSHFMKGQHVMHHIPEEDISDIVNGDAQSTQDTHKEETKARIASDGKDRQSIRKKLDLCVDPLDTGSHPVNIVNIVTGQIADSSVNVQDALAIGKKSMKEFEGGWPEGFSGPISKKVKTIADCHKFIKVGSKKVFDTTVIYSRVIGVQASSREIDIEKVISHELAPVPTSMFHDDGSMRILKKLEDSDVYLIFDRYPDYSTKSVTRDARECTASRVFQLSEQAPLPPQNVILTVSKNKVQLMSMICSNITKDKTFHSQHSARHKLVITGSDLVPTEIHHGATKARHDMRTSHEEADNIIVQSHRQAHQKIIPSLLGAHALSGCDTVPTYYGIGKGTVIRTLLAAPDSLSLLGCLDATLSDVVDQATTFIGACYSKKIKDTTMSGFRYKVWAAKFGKTSSSTPKIETLPPSTEAFTQNVKRAHLQACVWKEAVCSDPPDVDPVNFGYSDTNLQSHYCR
ncbi:unnamed protein product [Porites lobata]|uniref:Uncharacterized protein n=1 Tax=Porites lobata TaxID=104759 RepID=A0ABN8NTD6_9CNID|nr:unnamed protein product [Porites lobata]